MATFHTPEPIAARINLYVGEVRITASDRTDTVVDVRPRDDFKPADDKAVEQIRVDYSDGLLVVKSLKHWMQWTPFSGHGAVVVTIDLPTGSSIDGTVAMGDLRGEGEFGDCQLRTGMGDVRLDHAGATRLRSGYGDVALDSGRGEADVTTGSGRIRLGRIDGPAVVKNSNGRTEIEEVTGDLRVKAANGDIVIGRAGSSLTAKSANGAVSVGEVTRGSVTVETAVGELRVGVRPGTAAWLDLHSSFGSVRNTLDATDAPAATDERVEVRARTSAGDIVIERAVGADATNGSPS